MRRLSWGQLIGLGLLIPGLWTGAARAEDSFVITLRAHAFTPQVLVIPADRKVKVTVKNLDATPAEFESNELNREKIVAGNSAITVFIGPLKAGTYRYFDDLHTASSGRIEARSK